VSSMVDFDLDGDLEDMSQISDGSGLGDGALVSTAGDLILFYQALFEDGSLIEDESYDEMVDLQDTGEGDGYGLGIGSYETEYGDGYGHSGAVDGYLTIVVYIPDLEAYIAATFASDDADIYGVVEEALNALPRNS
jgi:D-alanyl-D-alanine carboxypeptidase